MGVINDNLCSTIGSHLRGDAIPCLLLALVTMVLHLALVLLLAPVLVLALVLTLVLVLIFVLALVLALAPKTHQ